MGKDIKLFSGVDKWFERINNYGKELGVKVEHYIISSGVKEIIEGTLIGKQFKEIFASEFYYDELGHAVWPKIAINYTNKTQYLMRISKGVLDLSNDVDINKKMDDKERRILFDNMIYIGDGLTDVPCMKLTKDNGGVSIAVYNTKGKEVAQELYDEGRVNYIARADYSEGSKIDSFVKKNIQAIALREEISAISNKV